MKTTTMLTVLLGALLVSPAAVRAQETFASPDAAVRALEVAVRATDSTARLHAIFGPAGDDLVSSGDPVEDAAARRRFTTAVAERKRIELENDGALAIVHVGHDDWPFPIPLVREGNAWHFDTAAGKDELLNRRIGRNELLTMTTCRTYVDAQLDYARRFRVYAQKLRSTPGQKDGLYWPASGRETSPLGPLVADATTEGYDLAKTDPAAPQPYHGYLYRILTAQGPHAPGGARDYVKDGKMTGGFALVAWPAVHGSSGVMTFIVNREGVVFQKDLGDRTDEIVKGITAYDPDESWAPTR